jgi:hypothetical protein
MAVVLVVVVAVVMLMVAGQRRGGAVPGSPSPSSGADGGRRSPAAAEVLDRAVERGLLTRELADRILATEAEAEAAPVAAPRVPAVAEALGYIGAILTMVGAVVLVGQYWEDLATWSRLALLGAVAAVLWLVGALLRDEESEVLWRLRGFVWLLAAGAVAGFTAVLVVDALDWVGEPVAISIGAVTSAFSLALWQLKNRPAQQLMTFVGMLVALGGVMALFDGGAAIGLSVAVAGGAWFAAGSFDRLPPKLAAVPLGLLALLIGPAITIGSRGAWEKAAPVIGLAIAATLIGLGAWARAFVVTGAGVLGVFVYLPWTLFAVFGDAVSAPVVLLVSGVLLLTVMLVLLHGRHGPGDPGGRRHPFGRGPARPALH